MIRMSAVIGLGNNAEKSAPVTNVTSTIDGNNISAPIPSVINSQQKGGNPFLIGSSILNGASFFSNGEEYYIGSVLSDSNASFVSPQHPDGYVITVSCDAAEKNSFTSFTIVFDKFNNQFPIQMEIDGKNIVSILPEYTFRNLAPQQNHIVKIKKWTSAHRPLIIHSIYSSITINCNQRNLVNIQMPIADRMDNSFPEYGIICNHGSIEFIDNKQEIKKLADEGLLLEKSPVKIYLEDTISEKKELIGEYITEEFSYNPMNFHVKVNFKDDLEILQRINVPKNESYFYPANPNGNYEIQDATANDILSYIYPFLKDKFPMNIGEQEERYLNKFIVKDFYLQKDNMWNQLQKICDLTKSYIYMYKNELHFHFDTKESL